jgi:hypothetical protein
MLADGSGLAYSEPEKMVRRCALDALYVCCLMAPCVSAWWRCRTSGTSTCCFLAQRAMVKVEHAACKNT